MFVLRTDGSTWTIASGGVFARIQSSPSISSGGRTRVQRKLGPARPIRHVLRVVDVDRHRRHGARGEVASDDGRRDPDAAAVSKQFLKGIPGETGRRDEREVSRAPAYIHVLVVHDVDEKIEQRRHADDDAEDVRVRVIAPHRDPQTDEPAASIGKLSSSDAITPRVAAGLSPS